MDNIKHDPQQPYTFTTADECLQIEEVLSKHFSTHRDEVIEWFSEQFPELDMNTYEGGIDEWFGLGSVTLFELGLEFHVKYTARKVEVAIF